MKKYISLFTLIALFFVGIQQTQAQETEKKTLDENQGKEKLAQYNELANKEKQQSPEHKAKVAKLKMSEASSAAKHQLKNIEEFVTDLSADQQSELYKTFTDLNKNLAHYDVNDKSKKIVDSRTALIEEANSRIAKILNEDQLVLYKEYLAKVAKADR